MKHMNVSPANFKHAGIYKCRPELHQASDIPTCAVLQEGQGVKLGEMYLFESAIGSSQGYPCVYL